jgi:predicted dehydrogenase
MRSISLAVTGLGGYAGWACDQLLAAAAKGNGDGRPTARLTAVCEPDLAKHAAKVQALRAAGIRVTSDLDELLAQPIDAVWLPLPIDLHRPVTERALAAGKPVLVEKPAAGCVDDVDAMIEAQLAARLPVAVGYQNLYDDATWTVKRRLLDGAIGEPISASVACCWPRTDAYFTRTNWAGKLKHNGSWVLDSPVNNAMAHFLNLALFLLGPSEPTSAEPISVEAELYRVNVIENFDTCCLRYRVSHRSLQHDGDGNGNGNGNGHGSNGVPLLVAFTHACRRTIHPILTITGRRGTMRFWNGNRYEITTNMPSDRGVVEPAPQVFPAAPHVGSLVARGFAAYLLGDPHPHVATLANARAHTVAINGASEAAVVHSIASEFIKVIPGPDGHPLRTLAGIEDALLACAADGQMLHESARAPWTVPAGTRDLRGYSHFTAPGAFATAMPASRAASIRELV